MAGVKANWFVDVPNPDDSDPFAAVGDTPVRVQDVGVEFDLRNLGPLHARVVELWREEAELSERDITCPVKGRADAACSACPVAHHEQPDHPLHRLCQVGREQERVLTEQAHQSERDRGA